MTGTGRRGGGVSATSIPTRLSNDSSARKVARA